MCLVKPELCLSREEEKGRKERGEAKKTGKESRNTVLTEQLMLLSKDPEVHSEDFASASFRDNKKQKKMGGVHDEDVPQPASEQTKPTPPPPKKKKQTR